MRIYKKLFSAIFRRPQNTIHLYKKFLLILCIFVFFVFIHQYFINNNQNYLQVEKVIQHKKNKAKNASSQFGTMLRRRNGKIVLENNNETMNGRKLTECRLPRIDPWDAAIVQHLDPEYWALGKRNVKCKRRLPQISQLKGGYVQIDWNLLQRGSVCQFRCLFNKNDLELAFGPWMDIINKCECDIVEVQCTFGGAKNYNYLHHQIYKRTFDNNSNADILPKTTISSTPSFEFPVIEEFTNKLNGDNGEGHHRPPDVHLIVLDSISHTMFLRSLSKTAIFLLERMEAVAFPHSNKVGKNSIYNAFAMFFGFQTWPIEENPMGPAHSPERTVEKLGENNLDNEPFIGFKFRERNYWTMMAEDWARGSLNWPNYPGFKQQPVHHYMSPFYIRYEFSDDLWGTLTKNLYAKSCKDYRHYLLDYLKQFIDAYEMEPKFSITWFNQPAHDSQNGAFLLDDDFYNFLLEYEKKFDNAFLFITGDHGLRVTSIRETKQGEVEDNNPALFIAVPKYLRQNSELTTNMRKNAHQLVTHFDTHATLLSIAMDASEWTVNTSFDKILPSPNLIKLAPFGQSLFRKFDQKIPRHCGTLPIPFEFCLCQFKKTDVTNDESELALGLAQIMVDKINADIREHNASEYCVELELKFGSDGMPVIECLELEPEKQLNIFQVTFETVPGNGRFWGYIQLEKNGSTADQIGHKFISTKFPRLNEYGKQSKCVDQQKHEIAPYCYCRDMLRWNGLWGFILEFWPY